MHKYLAPLLKLVEDGKIDPSFLISHRIGIEQVPQAFKMWQAKEDAVTKIVIDPWQDVIA
jgi:threonine dehydrogenase-like Zn-dependent dehydrogenase